MTKMKKGIAVSVLCLCLASLSGPLWAQNPPNENVNEVILLLKEIAALRADLDKPGMKDVFAGIGYIFGLFGMAAFVAARRKE
jgi:nickel transport protein